MTIEVLTFGQIRDITGNSILHFRDIPDTDTLRSRLGDAYPAINTVPFSIAVNKQMIQKNTLLADRATVALLPPFSGG